MKDAVENLWCLLGDAVRLNRLAPRAPAVSATRCAAPPAASGSGGAFHHARLDGAAVRPGPTTNEAAR